MKIVDCTQVVRDFREGNIDRRIHAAPIMALLGREVAPHARLGMAQRRIGASQWCSMPDFRSADDAALWLFKDGAYLGEVGLNEDGGWYAEFNHPHLGNDFADGPTMGAAMWAAFVSLMGDVERG